MATYVNNPQPADSANGMGFLMGIILLLIVVAVFFFYGLPLLNGNTGTGGAQVNLPSEVNVQSK